MHKNKPLVTIGIPFYNSENYLEFAVNSVIAQSYSNWILYLLDDGSTDKSLDLAKKLSNTDSRIFVISDGKNKGLPVRLNELSDLSTGMLYCRMDADDIMHPNRIEKQVEFLQTHPKIDVVSTGLITIDNYNKIIGIREESFKENYFLEDIAYGGWCAHPTIMGKSEWFRSNRYDESLKRAQDYDLWLRTVEKSNFYKIKEPYLYYREASTPTLKKNFIANKYAIKIYWKNVKILGIPRSLKMTFFSFIKVFVYMLFWLIGQTELLVKRRSVEMNEDDSNHHQEIINTLII